MSDHQLTTPRQSPTSHHKGEGFGTREFFFTAGWQVIEERIGATPDRSYVWSPVYVDAMIARDWDSDQNGSLETRHYALQDANFNVTALVADDGTVDERNAYDPYGVQTVLDATWNVISSTMLDSEHGHQGLRLVDEIDLHDNRMRWYSATLMRFVSIDPIGFAGGYTNLYVYVGNGPVGKVDPNGTFPFAIPLLIVAAPTAVEVVGGLAIFFGVASAGAISYRTGQVVREREALALSPSARPIHGPSISPIEQYRRELGPLVTSSPIRPSLQLPTSTASPDQREICRSLAGQPCIGVRSTGPTISVLSQPLRQPLWLLPSMMFAVDPHKKLTMGEWQQQVDQLTDKIGELEDKIDSIRDAKYGYGPHRFSGSEQELAELAKQLADLLTKKPQ